MALKLQNERDEPERALKCLKQASDIIAKECRAELDLKKDICYLDVIISYNLATCYYNMNMTEECADHLDHAIDLLNDKIE